MFKDENKSSSLAKQLTGFDSVILDTCSLMEDSFPEWLDVYSEAKDYLDPDFTIAVPEAAIAELKKHSHDRKNVDKRIPAIRALKIFKEAKRQRLLCVGKKNHNQNFADNAIYSQVSEDRLTQKILVITQDKKLATDLKNLNNLNSQKGRRVSVFKVVSGGKLAENRGEEYPNYQRTYEKNERRFSEKEGRFAQKSAQNRLQNNVSNAAQKDPAILEILLNDKKLNADLKNPNYPLESKISDIEKQLALLSSLEDEKKKGLSLLQGEVKLKQSLQILNKGPVKKETAEKPVSASLNSGKGDSISGNPQASQPEPSDKKKEEPTVLMKMPAKKLWYGEGKTLGYALDMVAEHYNLMFRDPSIAYVSFVHGPLDLTQNDREKILGLLQSGLDKQPKFESLYSSFKLMAEKGQKGFKVYLDLNPVASVQPETVAMAELPAEAKKETSVAPQLESKEETLSQPEANLEKKNTAERSKKVQKLPENKAESSNVLAVPNTSAAVPEGITLVVGIPTDQRKRDWIERTARRDALGAKSEGKKVAKKSTSKKKETPDGKESVEPTAKKAKATPKKPAKKEAAPSKMPILGKKENSETAKPIQSSPAKKPSGKQTKQTKKADPKPQAASPKKGTVAKKASPSPLEAALASEKKLKSNFHNPNYPSASKKKDIEEQLKAVRKLSPADRSKLSFGLDALKAMASLL